MGRVPEWYALLRASRYLHVAPWALLEWPVIWREWALAAETAESKAEEKARDKARKAAKKRTR